jgi:N-dimethylarginine dimethylaminohydrolase
MIPTTWKNLQNGTSALTFHHDDSLIINKGNLVLTLAEDLRKMT